MSQKCHISGGLGSGRELLSLLGRVAQGDNGAGAGVSGTPPDSLGGLVEVADWLVGLGDMEMAYVQARAGAFTDAEALRECGVPRSTAIRLQIRLC